jgi:hypothetical protein
MPQVTATIGQQESEAQFGMRIEDAANMLVDKYNVAEHTTYYGLQHGRPNHIFELSRIL